MVHSDGRSRGSAGQGAAPAADRSSPCAEIHHGSVLLRVSDVLNQLPLGAVVLARSGEGTPQLVEASAAAAAIVGSPLPPGTPLSALPFTLYRPDRATPLRWAEHASTRAITQGHVAQGDEIHLRRADGQWRVLLASAAPLPSPGPDRRALVLFQDITGQKEVELSLARKTAQFEGIFRAFPDLCFILDADGIYRSFFAGRQGDLYVPPDAFLGRHFSEVLPPLVVEKMRGAITHALAGSRAVALEYSLLMADAVRQYEARLLPLPDGSLMMLVRDITEQTRLCREAQENRRHLEESLALLDMTLRCSPTGFAFLDPELRYLRINPALAALNGLPEEAHLGHTAEELFPELARQAAPFLRRALEEGKPIQNVEMRTGPAHPGERRRHRLVNYYPVRTPDGDTLGVGAVVVDITERKRAEERMGALQAITAALSRAVTPAQVAEVVVGQTVRVLGASAGALILLSGDGLEAEVVQAVGYPAAAFPPDKRFPAHLPAPVTDAMHSASEVLISGTDGWDPRYAECAAVARSLGYEAMAAIPLAVEQRVLGTIALHFAARQEFAQEDVSFMRAIAGQAAQALDRARLYEAERLARAEAQEANAAKDQFIALVSHELRNPLAAITSALHVLREGVSADPRLARAVEIADQNARLQARLVNDLLDLSRLTRGKIQLQRTPVSLDGIARAVCQGLAEEARVAQLTLCIDTPAGLWVCGDLDRLQQVIVNLLSNAIKFTPAGGEVRVGVQGSGSRVQDPEPSVVHLCVEDTGIGMDERQLGQLFRMFQQGEAHAHQRPGLGIGLALSREIVERHGGRIWAESDGLGKGSRFILELPAIPAPSPTARHQAQRRRRRPAEVLVVEDNPGTRAMMADALGAMGYSVHAAGSGEEALALLERVRPAILLVDLGLPGIDGCETLRRARALPGMAAVPAFAVTGFGQEEDVRRGREAGFAGHCVKPVDLSALAERIEEWLPPEPPEK